MRLEIENLHIEQGTFILELSLELESGKLGVILGPSGCGKSTLLRAIAGLTSRGSGKIRLGDREIQTLAPEYRNIGFVFQDFALFPRLSVRDNISYGLVVRKIAKDERARIVSSLAITLKIEHLLDRTPGDLSGGEQQRVALARALAIKPDIVLLDEPLSSLDAELRRDLRNFIKENLAASGATALYVTHDLEEALEMADTLFIMREGALAAHGKPENIIKYPPDPATARFIGLGPVIPAVLNEFRRDYAICTSASGFFACTLKQIDDSTIENKSIINDSGLMETSTSDSDILTVQESWSVIDENEQSHPGSMKNAGKHSDCHIYFPASSVTILQKTDLPAEGFNLIPVTLVRVVPSINGMILELEMPHDSSGLISPFDSPDNTPVLRTRCLRNMQIRSSISAGKIPEYDQNHYLRIPCPPGFNGKPGIRIQLKIPKTDCIVYTSGQESTRHNPGREQ